ncbi:MAG: hypothetical protein H7322_07010 [Ramlibacter sp.]|nr:hypothetical protein [Ramlibacter sp.]
MSRSTEILLPKEQLRALSEFRHSLRRFLRFSEDAARDAGITVLKTASTSTGWPSSTRSTC